MSRSGSVSIRGDFLSRGEGMMGVSVNRRRGGGKSGSIQFRGLPYLQGVHTLARLGVNVVHEMHDDAWRAQYQRMHCQEYKTMGSQFSIFKYGVQENCTFNISPYGRWGGTDAASSVNYLESDLHAACTTIRRRREVRPTLLGARNDIFFGNVG